MTGPQIFSRDNLNSLPWPDSEDGRYARAYLTAFMQNGTEGYIRNIHHTDLQVISAGEVILPLTVTRYHPENAYTVSPYNHYISYGGSEEVHRLNNPPLEKVIQLLLLPIGAWFRRSHFDQVVYVNNWLLSTNLYPHLDQTTLSAVAEGLPRQFPDRPIVFRSVDAYRNPLLFNTLQACGYKMVLSRQVWYMNPGDSLHTRQMKEDQRVLRHHPYQVVSGQDLAGGDFERAVALYNQLYVSKYSPYNPQFTPAFFKLACDQNLLHFRALRLEGRIDGIMGFFTRNGLMTQPVFGYDTRLPQDAGLYRLLTLITLQEGLQRGLMVHASAGVGRFKKMRGAKSTIEYHAVYDRHLPRSRQLPWHMLKWAADQAIPFFKKNDF
jgi:hypothetical protein